MDDRIERLEAWSRGERKGPHQIEIHPTNICNMDCVMCGTMTTFRELEATQPGFHRSQSTQWTMPTSRFIELIDEAAELDVKRFLITGGGEPMLKRRATMGMVTKIKEHGMFGNMNTNGTLFNEKDVRTMVELGWDMIMFSVDSHLPDRHDFIRRLPGGFDLMRATLQRFKRIKAEMGTDKPKIVFNSVLSNRNYDTLDKILEFAAENGAEDVTFIPLIDFIPVFNVDLRLTHEQREKLRERIPHYKQRGSELGVHTNVDSIIPEKIENTAKMDEVILKDTADQDDGTFASIPCYEPYLNLVIRMTGAVGPCCMMEDREVSVREKSLAEIWYGDFFSHLRKSMEARQLFGACKTCVYVQMMNNVRLRDEFKRSSAGKQLFNTPITIS